MSKDMMDSVVRAAEDVPQERLELLAQIARDLARDNGDDWHTRYARAREQGLPTPKFQRNEHGHIWLTVTGLDLTGEQEIARLGESGFRLNHYAKSCLTSPEADGYNRCHRLEDQREYHIVLIPCEEVGQNHRTTAALQEYAATFGYEQLLAGIVPRIREIVSGELMREMGFWHITTLHHPIKESDGLSYVLTVLQTPDRSWLYSFCDDPLDEWFDDGAFAFFVPAS